MKRIDIDDLGDLLSADQAADALRMSRKTLDRLVAQGEIRFLQHRGRKWFTRAWLNEYLERQTSRLRDENDGDG